MEQQYDLEEVTPEVTDAGPVEDGGQAEVTDEVGVEADETPSIDYFDPTAYDGQYARVKLDGEEVEVPVTDLVNGYQRQADYTRKTQELAAQRERLHFWEQVDAAAKVNPGLALQIVQQAIGADAPQPEPQQADQGEDWGYDDPYERQLSELREMVAPAVEFAQQQQAKAYLDSVVGGLTQKYGDEFNPTEVITEALNRGISSPDLLESVWKEMMFDRMRASQAAQQQLTQKQAAEAQARSAAAQQAAATVSSGGSANGFVPEQASAQPKTIWEAWEQAKAQVHAS